MVSGLSAAIPAVVVMVVASALVVKLAATAVRQRQLAPAVARARRHGPSASVVALAAGLVAGVAMVFADAAALVGSGVALALAPLAFGLVHTVVLGAGERLWPRPRGVVRTASLIPRHFPSSLRWLRTACSATAVLVVVTCVTGWVTAGPDGRSITVVPQPPPGVDGLVGPTTAGPYPGAVFALPALGGTALMVLLTWLTVRAAMTRPAVPTDTTSEAVLRAASVHRVLRGSTAALLLLLGGLWFVAGTTLRIAGQNMVVGVDGVSYTIDGPPGLDVLGSTVTVLGAVAGLTALVLLLVPAARLQRTHPAPPGSAPVDA